MIQPENPRFTNVYLDRRNSHSILKDNETGVLYFMVRPGGGCWNRSNSITWSRWQANR